MGTLRAAKLSRREMFKMAVAGTAASMKLPKRTFAGPRQSTNRPNILFIMADQHRGDCLRADGNTDIRTPNLDTIAMEGARFRNAYSSTPSCIPARAAILTGLSPWHHGLLGMGGWPIPARYPVETPRMLADSGYYTTSIGKNHFFPSIKSHMYPPLVSHGYEQMLLDEHHDYHLMYRTDYHSWFWSSAPNIYSGDGWLNDVPDGCGFGWKDFWNAYQAKSYPYPERLHRARWVGDTAVRFLRNYDRRRPFFLKVSFIPPHSPYVPPERLFRQYLDRSLPEPARGTWAEKYRPRSGPRLDIWHGNLGSEQVHRSRAGYYGQVTLVDEQIGHILEELDARGWLEETLIFYCADHGDMLGDHYLWSKGQPYQSTVRIPMLLRWPKGLVSKERGQVISQVTELRDLLPTFLEAASTPIPEHVDGRSLLPLVNGRTGEWRQYIDLEHNVWRSPTVHWNALTDGHTKYIFHTFDGSEQLFDLDRDPSELDDLAANPLRQNELRLWRRRMVEHLSERGDAWVRNGKLVLRRESMPISPHYPLAEVEEVVIERKTGKLPDYLKAMGR